jgi:hypothetical protein
MNEIVTFAFLDITCLSLAFCQLMDYGNCSPPLPQGDLSVYWRVPEPAIPDIQPLKRPTVASAASVFEFKNGPVH